MKLACFFGHRWIMYRVDKLRASLMGHYNTNAGMDLFCHRCKKESLDAGKYGVEIEPMQLWGKAYRARMKACLKELGL